MPGTQRDIPYLEEKFQTGDIPTQQDFYDLFASYIHYLQVSQATGSSMSNVMSQKAITDELALKQNAFTAQNANLVFAGPSSGGSALPGFRALDADDIPSLDAVKITSGIIDIARLPAAALERIHVYTGVQLLPENAGLTIAEVQNGDVVKMVDAGKMFAVVNEAALDQAASYVEYSVGLAASVPWSGITGKPTTLAGYGITDAWKTEGTTNITDFAEIQIAGGNVGIRGTANGWGLGVGTGSAAIYGTSFQLTFDNTAALFNDSRGTKLGLQYGAAGYVTTDRSLTDRGYVLGAKTFTGAQTFKAGAAGVGLAPLYLQAGTALQTPADGALEYHASHLYFTIGSTRYQLDQQGGITNAAANNELMKSNGTNAVVSGLFSSALGSLSLGSASIAGNRTIEVLSSDANASLLINSKAAGSITLTTGQTVFISSRSPQTSAILTIQNWAGYAGIDLVTPSNSYNYILGGHAESSLSAPFAIRTRNAAGTNNDAPNLFLSPGVKAGTGKDGNIALFVNEGSIFASYPQTIFGSGGKVMLIANSTAQPSDNPADATFVYSADVSASSVLHFRNEAGDIIRMLAAGGWGTPSGTLTRTTFDSGTVTLPQLAERVAALITDLLQVQQLLKA